MKVLVVCSYKVQYSSHIAPFIEEQVAALRRQGVTVSYFLVSGRGMMGYLKERRRLMDEIRRFAPNIIHAHFGLSGLLANLQRRIPVVTTYHGSDINVSSVFLLSKISMWLSAWNIFVSRKNWRKSSVKRNFSLLPCGINLDDFPFMEKMRARNLLGWKRDARYVLFAGAFENKVKNAPLAMDAVAQLPDVELVEMKGFTRSQIATMMYASDMLLMTSFSEGSPQVIKEAMACGCPIVSVDVGDVAERIEGVDGCFLAESTPDDVAGKLRSAFTWNGRTNGREKVVAMGLDNNHIVSELLSIYSNVLNGRK